MNVYDFDNTIYRGESALDFFFFYLRQDPQLLRFVPRVFHALFRYKLGKMSVEEAISRYASFVEEYLRNVDDLQADAVRFWDLHEKKIKPFYKAQRRDDDVIVTASPENTMREICRRLGVRHCVGSLIDEETGKIVRLCMRGQKIPAFYAAFPDAVIDNFYTDSPKNDAPLIEAARHAFVVKGDRIKQIK